MVEMWQRRVEQSLFMPVSFAFRHGHPRMAHLEVPQVKEWGEANLARIPKMLDYFDGELGRRQFMAGDRFSVADITALVRGGLHEGGAPVARRAREFAALARRGVGPAQRLGMSRLDGFADQVRACRVCVEDPAGPRWRMSRGRCSRSGRRRGC
jgi:glutathione S-transferase